MVAHANDNQGTLLEEALTDFVDQCLQGSRPDVDEFVEQYPQCKTQLKSRLHDLRQIDSLFDTLVRAEDIEFDATLTGHYLTGRKIGRFDVREMIGRGGMGEVYLARDTRLDRTVAIKSMPAELQASSTAQSRFQREAKLLASLNHPNIALIHEIIEQQEGVNYLVLEYVPGRTLSQQIAHEPLGLNEALSIAQQIAEAVSAAHDKGVIHRDLKPGNIKITPEGKVKVLDFGLAKASPPRGQAAETAATQPGHIMGTPAYMSPEQACGKDTDYRTDIWSFGCLLYEMLTGKLPFEGETATDTVARILEREPNWQTLPAETPENIRTLLRRCLEKDPRRRLRDIGDAAIELRESIAPPPTATTVVRPIPLRTLKRWALVIGPVVVLLAVLLTVVAPKLLSTAAPGRIESLAVLPLENFSGDPNQEHYAEVITDELISALGTIGALDVRSRTSVMQYKDVKKPLAEIAQVLKVDAVVEGSVLCDANNVRITARLFHAPTDKQLWTRTYDREVRDIFTLYGEIARTIAEEIEITLTPDQEARLTAKHPIDPEAYRLYVNGMVNLYDETPEGTKLGLDYLRQAIEHDPTHPLLYGAMALGYVISTHGPGAPPDAFERAKEAALKALELDDNVAEAHAALAMTNVYRDWDWEGAKESYRRAFQLNPNLTLPRAHYAWFLLLLDRVDDALAQMKKVREIDPLMPLWSAYVGWQCVWAERYDEALIEVDKTLELAPNFPVALYVKGCACAGKGMYEQAIELHEKAGQLSPQWKCGLGHTYALAGRVDDAKKALAELEANYTPWDTWFIATIHAALGDKDQAFKWLEIAYGPPNHPYLPWLKYYPGFKSLRDDPRFADLLRRMNLLE
mgnify:CR=1 FL=1